IDVRMDAALRDESEQMDAPPALEQAAQHRVVEQRAGGERPVDASEVLVEAASGADRQVPDLGVAHLAGGQANGLARGVERRVRKLAPEPVEDRRVRELDRIARTRRCAAPAVEDDERYEWGAAARQIAANDSTSSDAPSTRAP